MAKKEVTTKQEVNKSYTFLTPVLTINYHIIEDYAINVFLKDPSQSDEYALYILYNYIADPVMDKIDKLMISDSLYEKSYRPSEKLIMYKFTFPPWFKKDLNLIIAGKYSEISEEYKKRILKYFNLGNVTNTYKVLYKTEDYRKSLEHWLSYDDTDNTPLIPVRISPDAEYLSVFNMEDEIFNVQKYLKKDVMN